MQEAITLAMNMAGGRSRQDLTDDPMLAMALTRCLEILGEAVSKLGDDLRLQYPGIEACDFRSWRLSAFAPLPRVCWKSFHRFSWSNDTSAIISAILSSSSMSRAF
jgi:uncharacterized protein with HEPN domain